MDIDIRKTYTNYADVKVTLGSCTYDLGLLDKQEQLELSYTLLDALLDLTDSSEYYVRGRINDIKELLDHEASRQE